MNRNTVNRVGCFLTVVVLLLWLSALSLGEVILSDSFNRGDDATVGINDNALGGASKQTYTEKGSSIAGNQLTFTGSTHWVGVDYTLPIRM
jgi:hypothetical protein